MRLASKHISWMAPRGKGSGDQVLCFCSFRLCFLHSFPKQICGLWTMVALKEEGPWWPHEAHPGNACHGMAQPIDESKPSTLLQVSEYPAGMEYG